MRRHLANGETIAEERSQTGTIKIAWTKGHVDEKDIEEGKSSEVERERKDKADIRKKAA